MLELIKKTLLTGVGLAVMTKDKVEELGKTWPRRPNFRRTRGKSSSITCCRSRKPPARSLRPGSTPRCRKPSAG